MKIWFYCVSCHREFLGEVPDLKKADDRTGRLGAPGVSSVFLVKCPFPDCGETAWCVRTWPALRRRSAVQGAADVSTPHSGFTGTSSSGLLDTGTLSS